jgi:hypothetical protein
MTLALPSRRAALLTPPWARNELWQRARAMPSLDLRFAESKSLIDAVSGRQLVTFTRASTGLGIGSDGLTKTAAVNEPRFTHDPVTGESLGLLAEVEARTNLLVRSEEFETTWGSTGLSARNSNQEVSPNGTLTADVIVETSDATATVHAVQQGVSVDSGVSYAASVYAKQGSRQGVAILLGASGFGSNLSARFDLSTGAVAASSPGVTASITPAGNGFYRCVAVATATATAATFLQIRIATDAAEFYVGNGTGSITLWGAQLEEGDFATSYIPTTTATATRSTDVVSIGGVNFNPWYRQDEGTLYGEYIIAAATSDGTLTSFDDGTASNRWQQRFTTIGQRYRLQTGGVNLVDDISAGAPLINATNKVAHTIRSGDQRYAGNGLLNANALTASPLPTVTQLQIGTGPAAGSAGRIIIRRLTYWPRRLDNNTLQELTR